jgi:hypothetical protein
VLRGEQRGDTNQGARRHERGDTECGAGYYAACQSRDPGPGKVYYLRKLSEGKTPTEARRALKRRLANVIYRHVVRDQKPPNDAAA